MSSVPEQLAERLVRRLVLRSSESEEGSLDEDRWAVEIGSPASWMARNIFMVSTIRLNDSPRIRNAIAEYPTMQFSYRESGDGFIAELQYSQQKIATRLKQQGLNEGLNALVALIRSNPGKRIPWLAKCTNTPEKTIEPIKSS